VSAADATKDKKLIAEQRVSLNARGGPGELDDVTRNMIRWEGGSRNLGE
jgi:hypothetical protein